MTRNPLPRRAVATLSCGCRRTYPLAPPKVGSIVVCTRHGPRAVTAKAWAPWPSQQRREARWPD